MERIRISTRQNSITECITYVISCYPPPDPLPTGYGSYARLSLSGLAEVRVGPESGRRGRYCRCGSAAWCERLHATDRRPSPGTNSQPSLTVHHSHQSFTSAIHSPLHRPRPPPGVIRNTSQHRDTSHRNTHCLTPPSSVPTQAGLPHPSSANGPTVQCFASITASGSRGEVRLLFLAYKVR